MVFLYMYNSITIEDIYDSLVCAFIGLFVLLGFKFHRHCKVHMAILSLVEEYLRSPSMHSFRQGPLTFLKASCMATKRVRILNALRDSNPQRYGARNWKSMALNIGHGCSSDLSTRKLNHIQILLNKL